MSTAVGTAVGWAPIVKSEKRDDGTLIITGRAASSAVDRDYQIADEAWLDKALGRWFGEPDGGNIREQHDGKRAVGTALSYKADGHEISALIVDPVTVSKIEHNVLRGFSWSARNARVKMDKAAAGGRIVDGQIYEVSVVDRPANPECLFTVAKADGEGNLALVEEPELVEVDTTEKADEGESVAVIEKADDKPLTRQDFIDALMSLGQRKMPTVEKADEPAELPMFGETLEKFVSAGKRKDYADKGIAMPNGDFPIPDKGHLKSAVGHYGNYKGDKAAAKQHIIKRARALGLTSMLPDDWGVSKADGIIADLSPLLPAIRKEDDPEGDPDVGEVGDISDGKAAIAAIARLIISEAESLATGRLDELFDIQMLCEAASALRCFVNHEADETEYLVSPKADDATADAATTDSSVEPAATVETETETTAETTAEAESTTEKADAPAGVTEKELSALLDAAITKAVQPYKDRLDAVEGELAKVLETPRPDGPARTRTTTHTAVAAKADNLRAEIALCKTWITSTGGDLQKGYRTRLDEAEAELAKLDGAA